MDWGLSEKKLRVETSDNVNRFYKYIETGLMIVGIAGLAIVATKKLKEILASLDPNATSASQIVEIKKKLAKRLKRPEIEVMEFNVHEAKISVDVVSSEEIATSFADIGGMETELEDVKDHIILPLQLWRLTKEKSSIIRCPTGVLLYGRPGTGKTLTAKGRRSV